MCIFKQVYKKSIVSDPGAHNHTLRDFHHLKELAIHMHNNEER